LQIHSRNGRRKRWTISGIYTYGSGTVSLLLPNRPLPPGSTPAAMLIDLARRVLPTMAGVAPSPTAAPTTSASPVRAMR